MDCKLFYNNENNFKKLSFTFLFICITLATKGSNQVQDPALRLCTKEKRALAPRTT